ncbi:MAG: acyloxyacyl hydrolase [Acidobacteria bacterium]|nr:acyloxyacyl hydrolase [Acidobacteriota bacterium]
MTGGVVLRRRLLLGLLLCPMLAAGAAAQPTDDDGAGELPTVQEPAETDASRFPPTDDDGAGELPTVQEPAEADAGRFPPTDDDGAGDPATIQESSSDTQESGPEVQESGPQSDTGWFLPKAFRTVRRKLRPETPEDWSLRFDLQPGVVGKTHPLPRNSFRSYRVELVRHTDGSALWHHTYRFPSYGAGVQFADFGGGPTDRGRPVSVYGFIQTPVLPPVAGIDVLTTIGMGVTGGWNPPAFEDFPFERHPTTRLTSYIDLGFQARRRLTDRLDLLAGFSLNHFSNGGVGSPNRGLTVTAPRVAVQRSLGVRGPPRRREDRPPFVDRWETRLDGGLAVRGVGFFWREEGFSPRGYVQVATLKGSVWRRFYRLGQVGGGLEGSLETGRPRGTARAPDADLSGGGSLGLYTGYEQIAGPFSIYLHFGTHLARTRSDERPAPFYRVGTIMRFAERWFSDVSFRFMSRGKDFSHDYIAWHLGYRFDGLPFPLNR